MNHIDLFSGIGGFALAARNVWGDEYNNVCFCEINKYAQAVLRKNFGKDVVICEDIRTLKAEQFGVGNNADCCGRVHGESEIESAKGSHKAQREPIASVGSPGLRIDLLTGGFPCQPFSQAGQRRGTEDDRFLWPEMLRVIAEFRPTWIIGENVAGLLSMAEFNGHPEVDSQTDLFGNRIDIHTKRGRGILFRIIGELEQIGYSVQTFVIPACAVGAPHRRDRVWIVGRRIDGDSESYGNPSEREISSKGKRNQESADTLGSDRRNQQKEQIVARHHQLRLQEPRPELEAGRDRPDDQDVENPRDASESERSAQCNPSGAFGDTKSPRLQGGVVGQREMQHGGAGARCAENSPWDEPWLSVATRTCVRRVDDGLPGEMDGATLSKAGHRVERLKALGNAIVPQVAEQIMRAIKNTLTVGPKNG